MVQEAKSELSASTKWLELYILVSVSFLPCKITLNMVLNQSIGDENTFDLFNEDKNDVTLLRLCVVLSSN